MSIHRSKWLTLALLVAGGGTLYQVGSAGCAPFAAEATSTMINWCWVVDCQNGVAGGLVLPCGDPTTAADDILADCPAPVGSDTTTDTTTDTTGTTG